MQKSANPPSGNKSSSKFSPKSLGRVFLIDGSALAYRSHFAFIRKPLINSKGENTGAVFGFTRSLLKIIDDEKPDYLAVVFDRPEPTFRHKKFAEYKATRERMPDELVEQLPKIVAASEALGAPIIQKPGFEADDIMATLAQAAAEQNLEVFLVSGDKDLMQLIGQKIKMLRFTSTGPVEGTELIDADAVHQKMGVPPSKIIDLLALRGDTSDNVPGVPGVGDVTARQLLEEFGSLDAVLERAAEVKKAAVRKNLIEHRDQALLSRELVTLDTQVPLAISISEISCKPPDRQRAGRLFRELEFNSLVARFSVATEQNTTPSTFEIIDTPEKLTALVEQLRAAEIFAFDTETTSANPIDAELVGISFAWREGHGVYVPIAPPQTHDGDDFFVQSGAKRFSAKKILQPILEDESKKKCGQNAKYDMLVMSRYGVHICGMVFDTMIASYLLNPGGGRQHNLDALALEHLRFKKIPTSDLIGSGAKQGSMRDAPVETVAEYAGEDADITLRLQNVFAPKLKEQKLSPLFEKVEMPLIPVLATVEATGVTLDLAYLQEMSNKLGKDLKKLEEIIFTLAGEEFNLNSPAQLSKILFEKLKLPAKKRTKTGFSTDADVLESLAKKFELPKILLDYRELSKLKSTYVDALPKLVNPRTGRVHTSYNQAVAATGRLSSSDPNLQNIPIRTEVGRQIRRAFVPGTPGWKLLDADYSQIELRIMAHLSKDTALMEIFRSDADVHRDTAGRMFNIPPEEVTLDMRRGAKEINFGIMYGMGAYGLSQRLQISIEEGEIFINNYFKQFPGVKAFIDKTIAEARANGYVTTLLGRRRYLPEINSDNRQRREFAERIAVNTPMQGSNADIIKLAMINIHRRLQEEKLSAHMILQVHDELVFEAPEEELPQLEKLVRHEMANAVQLEVPIKIGIGIGENWLEAHD
jgi:DNA polymerase-1